MNRASRIIPFTACCLVTLYLSTLLGFMAAGMMHTVEHVIAKNRLSPQAKSPASEVSSFRQAGCQSLGDDVVSKAADGCLDCHKHEKHSTVIVNYSHVFNFCSYTITTVLHVKETTTHFLSYIDESDQISSQPLIPPPEPFIV